MLYIIFLQSAKFPNIPDFTLHTSKGILHINLRTVKTQVDFQNAKKQTRDIFTHVLHITGVNVKISFLSKTVEALQHTHNELLGLQQETKTLLRLTNANDDFRILVTCKMLVKSNLRTLTLLYFINLGTIWNCQLRRLHVCIKSKEDDRKACRRT
jgi:hypothetical protein